MIYHRHILLTALLATAFLGAATAHAQDQTPGFNVPAIMTEEDVATSDLSVDFDSAFNTIPNPYLADTMKLNYQISLLNKMVARQAELQKISESYSSMGMSFDQPAPPRGICLQLPPNAPCLKFYPDLYSELRNDRKAYYDDLAAKTRAANAPAGAKEGETTAQAEARLKKQEAERKAKAAKIERRNRYQWSDVTCLSGQCHGVIVGIKNVNYRATVRNGTRLPDGTLVNTVNADGIKVTIDGEAITLRPAAAEGGGTSSGTEVVGVQGLGGRSGGKGVASSSLSKQTEAQAAIAAVLANSGQSLTPSSAGGAGGSAASAALPGPGALPQVLDGSSGIAPAQAQAAGQTMAEPAIGPSGLF